MNSFDPKALKHAGTLPHDRQFSVCRLAPDGATLFAAGYDGRLYRWRLEDKSKESFDAHRGWVEGMALHAGTERLFTADSWGQVHCWPIAAGAMKPAWTIDRACGSWLRSLAVSPDGKLLATCGNEPVVRVYSTAGGRLLHELKGHEKPVFSVAFSPDGRSLASGDLFGMVRHWSLEHGRSERVLEAKPLFKTFHQYQQGGVRAMTFSPDGAALYCGGFQGTNANQAQGTPTVVMLDWASGATKALMTPAEPFNGPVMDVVFHPAGWVVGSGSSEGGGALWFWKPGEEKNSHFVKFQNSFRRMDVSPDGVRLVAAAFGDLDGQRGGNGRKLNKNGEYPDFGGSLVIYSA